MKLLFFTIIFSLLVCGISYPQIDTSFYEDFEKITIKTSRYTFIVIKNPFQLITLRDNKIILESTKADISDAEFGPYTFLNNFGKWGKIISINSTYWEETKKELKVSLNTDSIPKNITYKVKFNENFYQVLLESGNYSVKELGFTYIIKSSGHWYGEGEVAERLEILPFVNGPKGQFHPLEKGEIERNPFMLDEQNAILTPFWLTSYGVGIYVDGYDYLHEKLNINKNGLFSLKIMENRYTRPKNNSFTYYVIIGSNIVDLYNIWNSIPWQIKGSWNPNHPLPPYEMFEAPIWTTWVEYKDKVNQNSVLEFAQKIKENDFPYKIIEIDDRWQVAYGDLQFDLKKFPQPSKMISLLKKEGFEVSLWVPPFVMKNANNFSVGAGINPKRANNFFVTTPYPNPRTNSTDLIGWWRGAYLPLSGVIDFTDEESQKWWADQLNSLIFNYGILGFKFDAGEARFYNDYTVSEGNIHPNAYADYYAYFTLEKTKALEHRAGFFSQKYGKIMREFDKNSSWDIYAGLHAVITQALSLGLIGYPYVLPDIIGGNEYLDSITSELFIRWTQVNAFMPMMQFSYAPWRFDKETLEIVRNYTKLHQKLLPYIWDLVKEARLSGKPIVRPLFFETYWDENTYTIDDQFMLGSEILVSPILKDGQRKKDVYIIEGVWKDLWNGNIYNGPTYLVNYPCPLDKIPIFIKKDSVVEKLLSL